MSPTGAVSVEAVTRSSSSSSSPAQSSFPASFNCTNLPGLLLLSWPLVIPRITDVFAQAIVAAAAISSQCGRWGNNIRRPAPVMIGWTTSDAADSDRLIWQFCERTRKRNNDSNLFRPTDALSFFYFVFGNGKLEARSITGHAAVAVDNYAGCRGLSPSAAAAASPLFHQHGWWRWWWSWWWWWRWWTDGLQNGRKRRPKHESLDCLSYRSHTTAQPVIIIIIVIRKRPAEPLSLSEAVL